jgi:hypothetical protein
MLPTGPAKWPAKHRNRMLPQMGRVALLQSRKSDCLRSPLSTLFMRVQSLCTTTPQLETWRTQRCKILHRVSITLVDPTALTVCCKSERLMLVKGRVADGERWFVAADHRSVLTGPARCSYSCCKGYPSTMAKYLCTTAGCRGLSHHLRGIAALRGDCPHAMPCQSCASKEVEAGKRGWSTGKFPATQLSHRARTRACDHQSRGLDCRDLLSFSGLKERQGRGRDKVVRSIWFL